ncbi:MAG: aminopeptidase [Desulfomonile tiedjei]|nr:aminopeptidase [Desulfomonile tiedjei]
MPAEKGSKKTRDLKEKLVRQSKRAWDKLSAADKKLVFDYAQGYLDFLNHARTERRAVRHILERAEKEGFRELDSAREKASRVFHALRGKTLAIAVVGKKPITEGVRLVTSHVDCPRLDLKPNPLYEDTGLALLKTHYYGGIKKYHWVARSLALCGTVIRADGKQVDIEIGLNPEDPVFTITDLLPHLARKQMDQKASEFIPGENLNLILGGLPHQDEKAEERVKLAVLEYLNKKYKITEEDFTSAEIQVVPAEPARDLGLDRSLIAGYGQDDRICAYACFTAALQTRNPDHAAIAIFYDKEEIGSEGNTSAQSRFLEMFLMKLMQKTGIEPTYRNLHQVFFNSKALSADVTSSVDPTYPEVHDKRNCARLGHGINITKYTGHGGKYMASEANAEYVAWVRKLFNDSGILWQAADGGKVDEGGGGTVAKYLAKTGMDIIDCGPPLLGMHSPLEVSSKEDLWMCHRAFKAFFAS